MKSLISLLILLTLTSFISQAQEFRAGPLAGFGVSQVDGDGYAGFHKVGLNLGAFVSRELSPRWDIQLDIAYMQKGSRKKPNIEQNNTDDYEIDLGYIQFPLVAKYKAKQMSFELGLSIGTLLHDDEFRDEQSIKGLEGVPPFKSMEYATVLGLNYHFTERLWINGRFLYSLNRIRVPYDGQIPVYDPRKHWLSRKPGQYNNNLVFSVYYSINRL